MRISAGAGHQPRVVAHFHGLGRVVQAVGLLERLLDLVADLVVAPQLQGRVVLPGLAEHGGDRGDEEVLVGRAGQEPDALFVAPLARPDDHGDPGLAVRHRKVGVVELQRQHLSGNDDGGQPGVADFDFGVLQAARQVQVHFALQQGRLDVVGDAIPHLAQVGGRFLVVSLQVGHFRVEVVAVGLHLDLVRIHQPRQQAFRRGVVLGHDHQVDQVVDGQGAGFRLACKAGCSCRLSNSSRAAW